MTDADMDVTAKLQDLDQLWNPADLPASKAAFEALIPGAEKLTGRDHGYLIELLSMIARAEAVGGNFAQAAATLEKAERLLEKHQAVYRVSARIRWLIENGRLQILKKTPSQARRLFAEAWSLALNSGEDYFAVEIAQMMAAIEPRKLQDEWIVRAIDIAENSPLPRANRWLGSLYATTGWKLYDQHQFDKALETFQKALRHLKAYGTDREMFVVRWSTGKVLRALGKTEEALAIQKALLAELGIGGARDGRLYEEVAECLQALKRAEEAKLYFELAYRELSAEGWIEDNQPLNLKRMKDLGKVK